MAEARPRAPKMTGTVSALALLALVAFMSSGFGCSSYRVEYRYIPEYKAKATPGGIPEREVLEDGTVLINIIGDKRKMSALEAGTVDSSGDVFRAREDNDDGSVTLRAVLPEHIVDNTLACLRAGEYQLLWDQLLSERTKLAYAERGMGVEDFAEFMIRNNDELIYTLRRMKLEFPRHGLIIEKIDGGIMEVRLHPVIARRLKFKFTKVHIVNEDFGMKLLVIR